MARKTISVAQLVNETNLRNKVSSCAPEIRQGWNHMLESILHDSGNYQGFGFYTQSDLAKDITPGIWRDGDRFKDTDSTRIYFYL